MTHAEQLVEGFAALKNQCDPRGHALLDALQNLCIVEAVALDSVLSAMRPDDVTDVIPLLRDYSMKVPAA